MHQERNGVWPPARVTGAQVRNLAGLRLPGVSGMGWDVEIERDVLAVPRETAAGSVYGPVLTRHRLR
jgi:hypothetical protein